MYAIEKGQLEVIQELIERGADINEKDNEKKWKDMEIQH